MSNWETYENASDHTACFYDSGRPEQRAGMIRGWLIAWIIHGLVSVKFHSLYEEAGFRKVSSETSRTADAHDED